VTDVRLRLEVGLDSEQHSHDHQGLGLQVSSPHTTESTDSPAASVACIEITHARLHQEHVANSLRPTYDLDPCLLEALPSRFRSLLCDFYAISLLVHFVHAGCFRGFEASIVLWKALLIGFVVGGS